MAGKTSTAGAGGNVVLPVFTSTSWQPDNPENEDANHDNPLRGTLVNVDVRTGGEWGDYPIVTVKKEDGEEVAVHAFRTVLLNEFVSKAPKIGEELEIHYGGTKTPNRPGAKPYHVYKLVVIGREGGAFAWGRFGDVAEFVPEPAPEPAPAAAPTGPTDDEIPY